MLTSGTLDLEIPGLPSRCKKPGNANTHQDAYRPGRMKFSRQSRLLKPAEFKLVFQRPIRSGDHYFRVLARANNIERHRLGMAVSRKTCPKAVGRNRIKRVVRESFRARLAETRTAGASLDFVVMPTVQAASQSNKILDESLAAHWLRLIRKAGNHNAADRQDRLRTQK